MKRFHVHVHVEDLDRNIAFYSAMFGRQPTRTESDYAKWMLDDPPVNFAISSRGHAPGVGHLGIQVDNKQDLEQLRAQAARADMAMLDEGETTCCYARSDKYWVTDPQGVAWEQFHTLDSIPMFGEPKKQAAAASACCAQPQAAAAAPGKSCC